MHWDSSVAASLWSVATAYIDTAYEAVEIYEAKLLCPIP